MAASATVFFGEETYLAFEYINKLNKDMPSSPEQTPHVERFDLKTQTWAEILDSARNMPLLFSSKRLLVIQAPPRKKPNIPTPFEEIEEEDKKLIKDYFSSPPSSTIMAIIFPGKIKRSSDLVRFFRSLGEKIQIKECKPLKEWELPSWIKTKIQKEGKTITSDAVTRLIELNGSDLGILDQELRKIAIFAGEENRIDSVLVNEISGWGKEFAEYDITNELEACNYEKAVLVIDKLLDKGSVHPVQIVHQTAGFMHNILLAKLRLTEGKKDRKAIFREIYPQIRESYGKLYKRKFRQLYQVVDGLTFEQISDLIQGLRQVDLKVKSTSLPFQPLIEDWIYSYVQQVGTALKPVNRKS